MTVRRLDRSDSFQVIEQRFHRFPYLQSWAWGEAQARYGRQIWRLGVEQDGVVTGVATVIQHALMLDRTYLYVPHGPIAIDTPTFRALLAAIIDLGRETNAMYVKIDPPAGSPDDAQTWQDFEPGTALQPRHTLMLNLTPTTETLLANMHQKTRYNIRVAEKRGVKIRWSVADEDFDHYIKLQQSMAARQGIRLHPERYYRTMFEVLRTHGKSELGIAELHGQPLAINEVVTHAGIAVFTHGGSSDLHKDVMAPYLLQWGTIERAKQRGLGWYDFRGIAPDDDPHHKLAGVTRFKRGFGGELVVAPPSRNAVLDRPWWMMYRLAKRIRGGVEG